MIDLTPTHARTAVRRAAALLCTIALTVILAACSATKPRPPGSCPVGAVDPELAAQYAFERVNHLRKARSIPPLQINTTLGDIAGRHSRHLAKDDRGISHEDFDKRRKSVERRMRVWRIGENVALSCGDAAEAARLAVDGWLDSPAHRKRMFSDFQISGIGVAQGKSGYVYFTQLFAAMR